MYVVGLSGGIGSGKSTVSDYFKNLHIPIIDADVISRDMVEPGSFALSKICKHFGSEILDDSGQLNRQKLRTIIFSDLKEKNWLETLLHPLIQAETQRQLSNAPGTYCIYSAPLLIENKLNSLVDRLLIVDVPVEIQLTRTLTRDASSETEIKKIMETQVGRQERLEFADDIIDNSGTAENTQTQVMRLHKKYLEFAKAN